MHAIDMNQFTSRMGKAGTSIGRALVASSRSLAGLLIRPRCYPASLGASRTGTSTPGTEICSQGCPTLWSMSLFASTCVAAHSYCAIWSHL